VTSEKTLREIQKAIATLNSVSGGQLEVEMPLESITNKILEAQAVISYFDTKGRDFHHETCRQCGLEFAYAYPVHTVKYCSIPCISQALIDRGLRWNPERTLSERYGRWAPAVVPPQALSLMPDFKNQEISEGPEDTEEPPPELSDLLNLLE
jgi:hypothetical protein